MTTTRRDQHLALFDLDGVILDSEPLHDYAKKRILTDQSINSDEDLSWSVGIDNRQLWSRLIRQHHLSTTPFELEQLQYQYIIERIHEKNIPLSQGLTELLDWLKTNRFKIGLASSSNRIYVDQLLNHYQLNGYFSYTVAGDEVPVRKPAPDIYLEAVSQSGIALKNALAIEDSTAGIRAAGAAGLLCIAYENPTSGNQNTDEADFKVSRLTGIIAIINRLWNDHGD